MEVTIVRLLKDGERIAGAVGYTRERGHVQGVPGAGGGAGHRRAWAGPTRSPPTAGSAPATGTPWPTTPGPSCRTWSSSSSTPPGMVWPPSVKGILVTEGVRGEGGVLLNKRGQALHVRRHPRQLQEPDRRQPRRGLALHPGRQERPPPARAADPGPRRPLYQPGGQGRPGQPPRRRVPGHRLDQGEASERRASTSRRSCRRCTTSSRSWRTWTSPRTPMEVGPTTHYVMGGVRVDADTPDVQGAGAVRRRGVRQRASTAPTGWAATRCPT